MKTSPRVRALASAFGLPLLGSTAFAQADGAARQHHGGFTTVYAVPEPRSFILTNTFSF